MTIARKEVDHMCDLSEDIWEKGIAEGKIRKRVYVFEKLMSKGMTFDEVADLLDITPDNAAEIKKRLNSSGNA